MGDEGLFGIPKGVPFDFKKEAQNLQFYSVKQPSRRGNILGQIFHNDPPKIQCYLFYKDYN